MASTSQTPATYTSQTNWLSSPQQQRVFQQTTVGAVSEIPQSFLVMLTPTLTRELVLNGHTVYFQRGFAQRAGFTDDEYTKAGAQLCHTAEEVYNNSTIILKVNPPQEQEYSYIRPQQVIFCFMNAPVTKEEQQQQQRFLQDLQAAMF
ncbi:alanine dehydrogenase, putative [Eimeria praecox]|uniref:Alanine dehydrogenase, putative n=1 Tax=Eimeria praecox TaxID=51316 RepID=U6G835_9EIME|nr:alanine dehydrogenase, putative [Eimeria praecox]